MVGRGGAMCVEGCWGGACAIYACLTFTLLLRDVQHILSGGKKSRYRKFCVLYNF